LLRHSFQLESEAACIESAVECVLEAGHRTRDLAGPEASSLSTSEMGAKVADAARKLAGAREPVKRQERTA